MNTDNIKRIAEGLFPDRKSGHAAQISPYKQMVIVERYGQFNPYESEADAFKVLEALVNAEGEIWLSESAAVLAGRASPVYCHRNNEENLKALICEAYLSLLGDCDE